MTHLSVDGVTKRFGRQFALSDLTLDVESGESLGLFGPNGAGKTTLLRLLSTLSTPTDGAVRLDGEALTPDNTAARRRIGVTTHDTMLYDDLTARENLHLHARLHGVERSRCETVLDRVGLATRASSRPAEFSHGMRKRLSLARALLHDPDVLLLDEPYAGLDRRSATTLQDVLDSVEARTVVMATHDFERGFDHCDRLVVLDGGDVRLDEPAAAFADASAFVERYRTLIDGDESPAEETVTETTGDAP